jgi:hypothetical protein
MEKNIYLIPFRGNCLKVYNRTPARFHSSIESFGLWGHLTLNVHKDRMSFWRRFIEISRLYRYTVLKSSCLKYENCQRWYFYLHYVFSFLQTNANFLKLMMSLALPFTIHLLFPVFILTDSLSFQCICSSYIGLHNYICHVSRVF